VKQIILFARAPVPGNVKTRLLPALTPEQAASLHEAFVRDMIRLIRSAQPRADCELWTDTYTDAWPELSVTRKVQISGDLGLKMLHAAQSALSGGATSVVILGADSPTLPPAHLSDLMDSASDVALGPAEDGGYWGIAISRVHPAMFRDVPWSTAATLEATRQACVKAGLTVGLGRLWYDVDSPADLQRLRADAAAESAVGQWLAASVVSRNQVDGCFQTKTTP